MSRPRLLLLSCSARKRPEVGAIPAWQRYDGVFYRVLRRYLRGQDQVQLGRDLHLVILSAEYGLLDGRACITSYDRRMDRHRAAELGPAVATGLDRYLALRPGAILLQAGQDYRPALPELAGAIWASGAIGVQQRQLKCWLWGEEDELCRRRQEKSFHGGARAPPNLPALGA